MAKTTADSVFASSGGGGKQSGGMLPDPKTVMQDPMEAFKGADKTRLDEDPFRKAAREQDERFDKAIEDAKQHQVVTDETGTSTTSGLSSGTTSGTSQTTFDPKGKTEQELDAASYNAYADQTRLVSDQEAGIKARSGVQGQARDSLGNIMGGQAFELSAGEEARINRLRDANIGASSNAVNALLTERLGQVSADAARRGLRGQAFTQLQGDAMGEAAKSLERSTLDANRIAADQAIAMPGQRVGIQAGTAGHFAGFAEELQQQAIANKQQLQDPVLAQKLLDERLKGGRTSTSGTSSEATSGTTSTTGKSTQTGAGVTDIMAAKAGQPSETGAQTAGVLGIGQVVSEIIPG